MVLPPNLHPRTVVPYLLIYLEMLHAKRMVHLYHHHRHVLHGCVVMIAKSGAAYLLNLLMSLEKQDGNNFPSCYLSYQLLMVVLACYSNWVHSSFGRCGPFGKKVLLYYFGFWEDNPKLLTKNRKTNPNHTDHYIFFLFYNVDMPI